MCVLIGILDLTGFQYLKSVLVMEWNNIVKYYFKLGKHLIKHIFFVQSVVLFETSKIHNIKYF